MFKEGDLHGYGEKFDILGKKGAKCLFILHSHSSHTTSNTKLPKISYKFN